jgi:hypothetical protein
VYGLVAPLQAAKRGKRSNAFKLLELACNATTHVKPKKRGRQANPHKCLANACRTLAMQYCEISEVLSNVADLLDEKAKKETLCARKERQSADQLCETAVQFIKETNGVAELRSQRLAAASANEQILTPQYYLCDEVYDTIYNMRDLHKMWHHGEFNNDYVTVSKAEWLLGDNYGLFSLKEIPKNKEFVILTNVPVVSNATMDVKFRESCYMVMKSPIKGTSLVLTAGQTRLSWALIAATNSSRNRASANAEFLVGAEIEVGNLKVRSVSMKSLVDIKAGEEVLVDYELTNRR